MDSTDGKHDGKHKKYFGLIKRAKNRTDTGEIGEIGEIGETGEIGEIGETGEIGEIGEIGEMLLADELPTEEMVNQFPEGPTSTNTANTTETFTPGRYASVSTEADLPKTDDITQSIDDLLKYSQISTIAAREITSLTAQIRAAHLYQRPESKTKTSLVTAETPLEPDTAGLKKMITDTLGEDHIYILDPKNPGLFLMINNINFDQADLGVRKGAEIDEENLTDLFRCMNYKIYGEELPNKTTRDLNSKQMDEVLTEVANINNESYSSLVIVISTHGEKGTVWATDFDRRSVNKYAENLKTEQIVRKFVAKNWAGKPKIIIFHACQGDVIDPGVASKGNESADAFGDEIKSESVVKIPTLSDILVVFSSDGPHPSIRNHTTGCYVLQEFVNSVKKYGTIFDLMHIMRIVIYNVAKREMSILSNKSRKLEICRQNPCFKSFMRKTFFFPSNNHWDKTSATKADSDLPRSENENNL